MANANKCDRCGAYCDEPGSKHIGGINIIPVSEGTIYTFDLCEDCLEDLYNFLRLGDEAKNKIRAQNTSSVMQTERFKNLIQRKDGYFMKKEEIKEFVQKHKKQLCIGAGLVIGGVSMYLLGRSSVKISDDYGKKIIDTVNKGDRNSENFIKFVKISDQIKKDSKYFLPIDAAGFVEMTGKDTIVDDAGVICKVAGGIMFVDAVRKVKQVF